MLQAFQGDAIDTGFVGSTPLIFAQAAGPGHQGRRRLGVRARLATAWSPRPASTDIEGWEDLKGKKVAYQRGTAGEAACCRPSTPPASTAADVTTVDLPADPGRAPRCRAGRPTPASRSSR